MLLDLDTEDDKEICSKDATFVEEKWLQLTEQDN